MPRRTLKLRLYPNQDQRYQLGRTLGLCRRLYNLCKEQRELAWTMFDQSITWYNQSRQLPGLKGDHPEFRTVHSQVLQNVAKRVHSAFEAFFEGRCGYPNWKSRADYRSFTYPQPGGEHGYGGFRYQDGRVYLSKIGWVRAFHEDKPHWYDEQACTPKICTVKEDRHGNWWAMIVFTVPEANLKREPALGGLVGLDAGLSHLATLSTGETITNPNHLKEAQTRLKRAQRDLSRKQKGSNNWHKQRKKLAKLHRSVRRKRRDHLHKVSRRLAQAHRVVAVEGNLAGLTEEGGLCQEVQDAAWGTLFEMLESKLAEHGGHLVRVDQKDTSKTCHACEHVLDGMPLHARSWFCHGCVRIHDRDVNAARVIENRARKKLQQVDEAVPTGRGDSTPLDTRGCKPSAVEVGARG